MDWLQGLFTIHSSVQTVVVVALIIATGLALGKSPSYSSSAFWQDICT